MSKKNNELGKKVHKWLEKQGYPLEMKVARIFQKNDFTVLQSEYFSDPDLKESREIDVVAYKQVSVNNLLFRITLTIECKLSKNKPWILFTSRRGIAGPARVAQRPATTWGRKLLSRLCQRDDIQNLPLFQIGERPAYGITQAFTEGKDVAFTAAIGASKAALSITREQDQKMALAPKRVRRIRGTDTTSYTRICDIVFPVIVVEGRLFESYVREKDETVVLEIESGVLLWRNPVVREPHTIIHIISSSFLEQFVDEVQVSFRGIFDSSSSDLAELQK